MKWAAVNWYAMFSEIEPRNKGGEEIGRRR
jgi:hypothetical protein